MNHFIEEIKQAWGFEVFVGLVITGLICGVFSLSVLLALGVIDG